MILIKIISLLAIFSLVLLRRPIFKLSGLIACRMDPLEKVAFSAAIAFMITVACVYYIAFLIS